MTSSVAQIRSDHRELRNSLEKFGGCREQRPLVTALALAEQSRTELQEQSLSIINYWYVRLGYLDHCNDFLYT